MLPGERWDKKQSSPSLIKLVEGNCLPKGRGLVPGCGRGYDVILLSSVLDHVTGLDISPVGIDAARETAKDVTNVTFINDNFFAYSPDTLFDVIYDYTFLCAIPPHYREDVSTFHNVRNTFH